MMSSIPHDTGVYKPGAAPIHLLPSFHNTKDTCLQHHHIQPQLCSRYEYGPCDVDEGDQCRAESGGIRPSEVGAGDPIEIVPAERVDFRACHDSAASGMLHAAEQNENLQSAFALVLPVATTEVHGMLEETAFVVVPYTQENQTQVFLQMPELLAVCQYRKWQKVSQLRRHLCY